MKFCWVTINVKDMEESLHFYQEIIGLTIRVRKKGSGLEMTHFFNNKQVLKENVSLQDSI